MKRTGKVNYEDDIAGLTAWLTTPFVPVAVGVLFVWLAREGFLSWQWWGTWLLATVITIVLLALQQPLYQLLLGVSSKTRGTPKRGGPISTTGCFAGLWLYGACLIAGLLALWQFGLNGAIVAVIATPLCSFGSALLVTNLNRPKKGR